MRKLAANILIFFVIFGISFSNIPFYALTEIIDSYIAARNIVDKAWHLSQNENVVDTFTSYRNLTEKIKIREAQAAIIAQYTGGLLVYADTVTVGTPKYQTFDDTTGFGTEQSATSVGASAINWIRVAASPTNDEWIIATRDAANVIKAQVCTGVDGGVSCGAATTITATAGTHGFRNYDIAYEQTSGDALLVYGNATIDVLRKIEWAGGSWVNDAAITTTRTSGTVEWVELTSRNGSDQIGIAYSDTNDDVSAYRWNGTAAADEATAVITATAVTGDVRKFDVSFEGTSGDMLVVAWVAGAGTAATGQLVGTTWTIGTQTGVDNITGFVDLQEPNPSDNDIAVFSHGTAASANPGEGFEWSGTGVSDGTAGDDVVQNWAANYQLGAVSYLSTTYYGVAVHSSSATTDDIDWWTMNSAGSITNQSVNTRTRGASRFIDLFDYPSLDKALLITADANSDLWVDTWDGAAVTSTAWTDLTSGGARETSLSTAAKDVVDFAFRLSPPPDSTPPTPNPMTFATAPNNFSTTQIDMTSTAGSDPSTPISYLFTSDNSSCGANAGTGGASSGWQSADTTYSNTGLQPNKCYGYTVQARDSLSNTGTASGISSTYTSANAPGTPTLGSPTTSTLALTNAENGNPASNPTTNFAVQVVTTTPSDATWLNQWVDASGNPSASAVWLTDAQLDALVLQGLQASTLYGVQVKARNQDTDETALSAEGQGTTSAPANTTTIADGTDPGNSTIAPGASITDLDAFTLVTSGGTDSVTALTVTLTGANSFESLSEVRITSDNGATLYFAAAANPASNTVNFSGGTAIPVSTSATQFKVRITPKSHANMPVPPGLSYAVGGTVTAFTSTNAQAGADSATPATITVDNASPNGATSVSGTAGDTANTINWTTSNSADFNTTSGSVIYRWTAASAGSEVPVEGSTPSIDTANGTATVVCVISSAASAAQSKINGTGGSAGCSTVALTNGTAYTYKAFQKDTNGNYDVGVLIGTFTPGPTIASVDVTAAGGGGCPTGTTVANTITSARQTDTIRINGSNFGAAQGGSTVTVNGSAAVTVGTWTSTVLSGIAVPSDAGNTGNIVVTVGSTATFAFTVLPRLCTMDVTASSAGTPIANGITEARQGDTIRYNGDHFGAAQGAGGIATVNGSNVTTGLTWSATVISGIVIPSAATDTGTVSVTRDGGGASNTKSFTVLPSITTITNCDKAGFPSGAYGREYNTGDAACPNTLTDGAIIITGNHFGGAGTITLVGQTATQSAVAAFCGGSAYTSTCIAIQVPTTIADSTYTGNMVVNRTSDSKTDTLSGFRVLPRIASNTPGNGTAGDTVKIAGDHFCQSGTCPVSPNRSSTADNVKFGSTQALDGDFQNLTGAGTCAGSGAAWIDTEICVNVPAGTPTGSQPVQVTSTASAVAYTSNTQAFTVNSPTPADPGNLKQSRNSAFTDLIALTVPPSVASSTPAYFSADTSSSVSGGTMYLQVEMRPVTGGSSTFDAGNICAGNAYCFEGTNGAIAGSGTGSAYSGGSITLTSATTSADENYHWRTRVRYNKSSTDYYSGWIAYGGNSEAAGDLIVDTVSPVISSVSSGSPGTNTATITWDTQELATTQVQYNTTGTFVTNCATNNDCTTLADTPANTAGKTVGHSASLSNLNSAATYYYRVRSKDQGIRETIDTTRTFTTAAGPSQPAKTASFHIAGATGLINNSSPGSYPFTVSLPENATSTQSAFIEISGVYSSGADPKNITVQVTGQGSIIYVVPASTTSHFKIMHRINPVLISNTLTITPQTNTTVYVTSAKITITYAYTP